MPLTYVSSIFRDSESYIERYTDQVVALADAGENDLRLVVAEGDSTDSTYDLLWASFALAGLDATVLKIDHGGKKYPSIDHPKRWEQIAFVDNMVMACVSGQIEDDDVFVYIESDLAWPVDVPLQLIKDLEEVPAVAPMSMNATSGQFYDVWGMTKDGVQFGWNPPYHPGLNGEPLVEIDTAGSCFVTSGSLARKIRFSPVDCIRAIGRDLRKHGASLWLDTRVEVLHG